MRRVLSVSLASMALFLVPSFAWFSGCSGPASGDGDGGEGGDELFPARPDGPEEGPSFCFADVYTGGPCETIAPDKVYCAMCEAGGCFCIQDPKESDPKGVWMCHVDTSCAPKCAPDSDACELEGSMFVDTGPIPDSFVLPDATSEGEAGAGDGG